MHEIRPGTPDIRTAPSADAAGREAAERAAGVIRESISIHGRARVIFASAPSQDALLAHLAAAPDVDWSLVHSFHMDEYLGLPAGHSGSFGHWLAQRLPAAALPQLHRIDPDGGTTAEAARYSALIEESPIDLVCLGIGVNGHIAFNEPGDADFDDPATVRLVTLDTTSRQQQVTEGLFPTLDDVPTHALSLTVPALLSARTAICSVIGAHKATAVARALTGPVDESSPASSLRTHADVSWFLDEAAASTLEHGLREPDTTLQA